MEIALPVGDHVGLQLCLMFKLLPTLCASQGLPCGMYQQMAVVVNLRTNISLEASWQPDNKLKDT